MIGPLLSRDRQKPMRLAELLDRWIKVGLAQAESCCDYVKLEKIMKHMHDIIPKLFDCWADPVAHLLLLKSSMVGGIGGPLAST